MHNITLLVPRYLGSSGAFRKRPGKRVNIKHLQASLAHEGGCKRIIECHTLQRENNDNYTTYYNRTA